MAEYLVDIHKFNSPVTGKILQDLAKSIGQHRESRACRKGVSSVQTKASTAYRCPSLPSVAKENLFSDSDGPLM